MIEVTIDITGDTFAEAKEGAKAIVSAVGWPVLKTTPRPSGKGLTLRLAHGDPTPPTVKNAWWAEARERRANGETLKAISTAMGKSLSAVCYATSPAALQTMRRYSRKE